MNELERQIVELRRRLERNQFYLAVALAVIGLGALASIGLVGFYGWRLGEQVRELRRDVTDVNQESHRRTRALSMDLVRQQQELSVIREAATRDLTAIREAHSKIATIRDPDRDLAALRDANQALWSELATQRTDLLEAIDALDAAESAQLVERPETRFQLGETFYAETGSAHDLRGFVAGDARIRQGSAAPSTPAYLVIEVSPENVQIGDSYTLEIRAVNRSNRALAAASLRVDWSFAGKNTGGDVPLAVARVGPRETAILYAVDGLWTPAHERGPVVLNATLALDTGERLANRLSWN